MNIDREELLSALQKARGKGLSLKQLGGQLHLGQAGQKPLRRTLAELLGEGRIHSDGRIYRLAVRAEPSRGDGRKQPREPGRAQPRRAPAVMLEGARMRREKEPAAVAKKPEAQVTGVIHVKS